MTLPNWNLNEFYSSFTSDQINKDIKSLKQKTREFSSKFKGKLKLLKKKHLLQTLVDYEEIEELVQKIKSFAYLTYCTDQLNEKKKKFYQFIEESISEIEKIIIFYGIELNSLNDKKLSAFSGSKYKNWIKNHKKFKKFQKSEDNEKILVEKSLTGSSAWIKFFDQSMTRLKFRFKENDFSETEILNFLTSSDQKTRQQAAEVFGKTLKDNIFNFSYIINTISKDLDIDKNIRGFKYSESSRHLLNQIDKSDVDSLVKSATENYSKICHRYYKYKTKYFRGKKLKYWDRNAPYPNTKDFKISWNQAKEIVMDSYYSFDARFGDIVKLFFQNNWIDAKVSKGKTSGAFSHPTVPSCSPRILVNFQGKIHLNVPKTSVSVPIWIPRKWAEM